MSTPDGYVVIVGPHRYPYWADRWGDDAKRDAEEHVEQLRAGGYEGAVIQEVYLRAPASGEPSGAEAQYRIIGTAIRDRRVAAGMSLRELGAATGIHIVELGKIERGLRLLTMSEAAAIRDAIDAASGSGAEAVAGERKLRVEWLEHAADDLEARIHECCDSDDGDAVCHRCGVSMNAVAALRTAGETLRASASGAEAVVRDVRELLHLTSPEFRREAYEQIGAWVRGQREARGMGVREFARACEVNAGQLSAIEGGDLVSRPTVDAVLRYVGTPVSDPAADARARYDALPDHLKQPGDLGLALPDVKDQKIEAHIRKLGAPAPAEATEASGDHGAWRAAQEASLAATRRVLDRRRKRAPAEATEPSRSTGTTIRNARTEAGMSLRALAAAVGISNVELGEIERGVRLPDANTASAILAAIAGWSRES